MSEEQSGQAPSAEGQGEETQVVPESQGESSGGHSSASVGEKVSDALASGQITEADLARKVRVKIDGAEREITLQQALRDYELRAASHKRLEEAAKTRKEIEAERQQMRQVVELLRDPAGLLSLATEMGVDPRALAQHLQRELETPEDVKRLRDIERREKALRDREESEKRAREQARLDAETRAARERYQREFTEAAAAEGLPKSPEVISRMARLMSASMDAGTPITAAEAAASVAEELQGEMGSLLSKADEASLRRLLGDERLAQLRKAEVDRAVGAGRNATRPTPQAARAKPPAAKPVHLGRMTPDEWREYLDAQQRGQ